MKILEINGFKYNQEQFDNYTFRARVEIETFCGRQHFLDIYTTNPDMVNVENILHHRKSEDVSSLIIVNWVTKKEDEAIRDFLINW